MPKRESKRATKEPAVARARRDQHSPAAVKHKQQAVPDISDTDADDKDDIDQEMEDAGSWACWACRGMRDRWARPIPGEKEGIPAAPPTIVGTPCRGR